MPTRTATANDGFPWGLLGAILGVITIVHVLDGKKVSTWDAAGAVLSIASFLADR